MKAFHWLAPTGHLLEGLLELSEVLHLDHPMEFTQTRRAKGQLAPRQTPARDQPAFLEVLHIGSDVVREAGVGDAGLQIAPGMIDVQFSLLQPFIPVAITAAIGSAMPSTVR
jgi:hypothetical protein